MTQKTQMIAMGAGALVVLLLVFAVLLQDEEPAAFPDRGTVGAAPTPGGGTPAPGGRTQPPVAPDAPIRRPGSEGPQIPIPPRPPTDPQPRVDAFGDPLPAPADPVPDAGPMTVQLECVDGSGAPLQGVTITPTRRVRSGPEQELATATSDPSGVAFVSGLSAGDTLVGVGRHPLSRETVSFGPVQVSDGVRLRLNFRQGAAGTVVGRIVDDRGDPVREAELILRDPNQQGEAVLDTVGMNLGPDGSFRAQVAATTYAVSARGPGLSESDLVYVTVPENGEGRASDLVLSRQGTIAGRLELPPDLQAVLPLALDVVFEITRGGDTDTPYVGHQRRPLQVDPSMYFELAECDPGEYRARLELQQAGGNRVGPWAQFTLKAGQRLDGIDLRLAEMPVAFSGTVRDDFGTALEGVEIVCGGRSAVSDPRGEYSIRGLDRGPVSLQVRHEGYAPVFFQLEYDGSPQRRDITLPRTGSVEGKVITPRGPVAGTLVLIVERQEGGVVRPHQLLTSSDGSFRMEGLPPGDYYVKCGRGADPFDDTGAETFTIEAGREVKLRPMHTD